MNNKAVPEAATVQPNKMHYVTRPSQTLGYMVSYKQSPLTEYPFTISNLASDLRDGLRLCRLAEILTGRRGRGRTERLCVPCGGVHCCCGVALLLRGWWMLLRELYCLCLQLHLPLHRPVLLGTSLCSTRSDLCPPRVLQASPTCFPRRVILATSAPCSVSTLISPWPCFVSVASICG